MSIMFSQDWPLVQELIAGLRARYPHTPIIAGGEHVTALTEVSFNDAPGIDYIVTGEGDLAICELVEFLEGKRELEAIPGIAYRTPDGIVKTKALAEGAAARHAAVAGVAPAGRRTTTREATAGA